MLRESIRLGVSFFSGQSFTIYILFQVKWMTLVTHTLFFKPSHFFIVALDSQFDRVVRLCALTQQLPIKAMQFINVCESVDRLWLCMCMSLCGVPKLEKIIVCRKRETWAKVPKKWRQLFRWNKKFRQSGELQNYWNLHLNVHVDEKKYKDDVTIDVVDTWYRRKIKHIEENLKHII